MNIAIILNYMNYGQSIKCGNTLLAAHVDKVIIVDNGSTNSSYSKLKKAFLDKTQVYILSSGGNKGYARGNNVGLYFAEKKWGISEKNVIFIVNPDSIVTFKNIDDVSGFILSTPNVGAVTVKLDDGSRSAWHHITPIKGLIFNSWVLRWTLMKLGIKEGGSYAEKEPTSQPVDVILGAFFGIKQQTFKRIQYFDENTFLYYEEEIIYAKLAKKKMQSYLLRTSSYKHVGGGSTSLGKVAFKKINDQSRLYVLKEYYQVGMLYESFSKLINYIDNILLTVLKR
ncbi:glycosyltransferase [Levilactobacillus suantsaiihabitans]|uniref:Glycosyltransferase family 2 protein n=1 Tax=Levilactobacillus suantsaiihabitans TaxID=2487722 RepID=A0A4Z0J9A4_9LACO|nr:glycosyltransferase [Levilactobacillus suantsaiihabitans]TGD18604.1 glycosyltransferase family 2 protein [Levilactobacillus suantsaiihabitans]